MLPRTIPDSQPAPEPATVEEAKAEIERINQAIAALEGMVISRSNERAELQMTLRETDTAIAQANQSIDEPPKYRSLESNHQ